MALINFLVFTVLAMVASLGKTSIDTKLILFGLAMLSLTISFFGDIIINKLEVKIR